MSLQHVVLFHFPRDLDAADWAEMQRQVHTWPVAIGDLPVIRLGPSLNTDRTQGYQYLLYMQLADQEDLSRYQQHPVHQDFLRWVTERDCTALAFDYNLDATTVINGES